jgi:sterol desaturase/sphingolipid hydroxylase (fatty acid hydroxylase superfamily)
MNETAESALALLSLPGRKLIEPGDHFSLLFLAASLVFVGLVYAWSRRGRRRVSLRRFVAFALPRRILLHRSSLLDYRLYVVNAILLAVAYGAMIVGAPLWAAAAHEGFAALFGPAATGGGPSWALFALTTVLQLLAIDLGYWLAHWVLHKVPFFWEFHKVHHSAEVMTPFTEWRQHPLEMVFFPNVYGFTAGFTHGTLVYWLGPEAQPLTLFQTNVLLIAFLLTIHHLRHSHIWMPATGLLGRILHSPAHHQLHHSTNPRHYGKNLGFSLSVWDALFGTLVVPRKHERVEFGIGPEGLEHASVTRAFWLPVKKGVRQFVRAARASDPLRPLRPRGL